MSDDLVRRLWKGIADTDAQQDAADTIEALTAQLAQRDAALAATDELIDAVTHEREMVCQDFDMQFKASQAVGRCLDACRKARGQDATAKG